MRVNGVAPGFIDGGWLQGLLGEGFARARDAYVASTPLRRVCSPEDVAGVVAALLAPASNMVTGQTLCVDGGMTVAGFSTSMHGAPAAAAAPAAAGAAGAHR